MVVDFKATEVDEDYSVPVAVALSNNTTDADEYEWSFSGGEPATSSRRNPGTILYKEPGTYTIT